MMGLTGTKVCGQQMTIAKGEPSKALEADWMEHAWYLGRSGESDCWLTWSDDKVKIGETRVKSGEWMVVGMDRNLRLQSVVGLSVMRRCEVLAVREMGGTAHVIMVDSSDAKSVTLLKGEVKLDSLLPGGIRLDTIVRYGKESKDRSYVWGAVSGNGEYVGVVMVRQMTKRREYKAEVMVYDGEMAELWRKEYAVGTTSSMAVTDGGEVVTLGYQSGSDGALFTINVVGPKDGERYEAKVGSERLTEMQIVNVLGRRVLCAGVFSPRSSDEDERIVGGTVSMVFDIDSGRVTRYEERRFQNEDLNILMNTKTKKVRREPGVPMVVPLASVPMPYGAVVAFGHRHVLHYVNANGTVTTSYYGHGIHLVALTASGEVKWVRNLRRNDMQKNSDEMLFVALFASGDNVCLAKSEHRKYPAGYDIAKDAKEYEMGDKGNLVVYTVGTEGEVRKTVLEQKTKQMLVSAAKRDSGDALLLTVGGGKSRMMELKIE